VSTGVSTPTVSFPPTLLNLIKSKSSNTATHTAPYYRSSETRWTYRSSERLLPSAHFHFRLTRDATVAQQSSTPIRKYQTRSKPSEALQKNPVLTMSRNRFIVLYDSQRLQYIILLLLAKGLDRFHSKVLRIFTPLYFIAFY